MRTPTVPTSQAAPAKLAMRQATPFQPPPQVPAHTPAQSKSSNGVSRRMFFSRAGALTINVNLGELIAQEGKGGTVSMKRVGEKIIQFTPFNQTQHGGMKGGYLGTNDPEIIAFLEKRAQEVGDVFTEETWHMAVADDANPQQTARTIVDQNRMIQELQNQNEALRRQLAESE